jgi:cytidine deaminase
LTTCAERVAIFVAVSGGFRRLKYLVVSCRDAAGLDFRGRSPCGACRQVICEFADDATLVIVDDGRADSLGEVFDVERLLPFGFVLK